MCLLMNALIYHTLKNKRNTKNKLQQRPAAESMALNCWNQCNLVVREFNSNAALPMPQNYHFNFNKDTPCRCTQADTQPPLHLRAFASQYLPCPFQTQQHDNQPFISLSSLSPSILPPSLCYFVCHPNMETLLNDTQISSYARISCYILSVDIPEEEKNHLCVSRSIKQ